MAATWWSALAALSVLLGPLLYGGPRSLPPLIEDCPAPVLAQLGGRLLPGLGADTVFGLPAAEAAWVLYPVTRERALPASYAPSDLVWTTAGGPGGAQAVRRLVLPDLEAMFGSARANAVTLGLSSGYRSYAAQAALFDGSVQQWLARGFDRAQAEARADRFRARPGHSQHQLGTTVDLTSPEVGNGLRGFGDSRAGRWVRERAWEFGFVLPYTELGESRTGYASEPWHVRWVGRDLAALLMADGYLDRAEPVADDYLLALDALLSGALASCGGS